jgi:MoxR-like ATPase
VNIAQDPFSNKMLQLDQVVDAIGEVLLGKQAQIKLAIVCMLASGHLLIEDRPGMGKTTLAHALADILDLSYKRVQFTSDLLPSDLLGVSIYNPEQLSFEYHKGPIFTQLLLADEINRSSAKTQSALLEAMEEHQVSSEGVTRALDTPFFVIATQNPSSHSGTYTLPDSQLDRFLMRIELGYPSFEAERKMLQRSAKKTAVTVRNTLPAQLSVEQLTTLQIQASNVEASERILDYIQRLVLFTREDATFSSGVSPRGSLALLSAAKAWALLCKRDYVLPEDIQQVFIAVIGHRLTSATGQQSGVVMAEYVLANVDVLHA